MNKKPTAEEVIESPQIENLKAYIFKPYELTVYQKALAISEFNKLMAYTKTLEEAHANNAVEEYKRDMVEILKSSLYEHPQNEMQEGAQIIMNSLIAKLNMKNMTVYTKEELRKLLTNKD